MNCLVEGKLKMKTIIVCVNYNSYEELDNYIQSIEQAVQKFGKGEVSVIVVDNSDPIKEYTHNGGVKVLQYKTKQNLGYFGGISYGIKESKENLEDYDFIIISNVDLLMPEDFFEKLYAEQYVSNIGCIAPSIISKSEGNNRNPKVLYRYSATKLKVLRLLFKYPVLWYTYNKFLHRARRKKVESKKQENQDIYAAHGSFMIFTNKAANFLENMKFPTFMFCEELFVAENLLQKKLRTVYRPSICINDIDHVSTSKMKSKFYFNCNYESLDMILKEYYCE